jgi:hypothetical protein
MAHAHCMPDKQGYSHALRIRNNYCVSTTTIVAPTRLSVTLYVHCLSCSICFPHRSPVAVQTTLVSLACCYAIMNSSNTKRCASIRYRRRCCHHKRDLYRSFLLVTTVFIYPAWETLLVAQLPPA